MLLREQRLGQPCFFSGQQPRDSCFLKREQPSVKWFLFNRGNRLLNHTFFQGATAGTIMLFSGRNSLDTHGCWGSNRLLNHTFFREQQLGQPCKDLQHLRRHEQHDHPCHSLYWRRQVAFQHIFAIDIRVHVQGASKIKLKKVNKTRTVTDRRLIIFLNISRRPLLICLHCCLHQYKTLKAVATAKAALILLTPAKNLDKVFWGFLGVSPLFNHYQGYV